MLFYRFWVGRGQTQSVSMCRDMPNAGNMNLYAHEVDHVWIWADTIETRRFRICMSTRTSSGLGTSFGTAAGSRGTVFLRRSVAKNID